MRYKVDLKKFMAECETNYVRLRKLMPRLDTDDSCALGLPGSGRPVMRLEVLERSPYTVLLAIRQQGTLADSNWLPEPCLKVRLYHDARLAEVVACAGVRTVYPRYPYPNNRMHQPDEKAQWNSFLSDWLTMAIGHGYSVAEPCEFVG